MHAVRAPLSLGPEDMKKKKNLTKNIQFSLALLLSRETVRGLHNLFSQSLADSLLDFSVTGCVLQMIFASLLRKLPSSPLRL